MQNQSTSLPQESLPTQQEPMLTTSGYAPSDNSSMHSPAPQGYPLPTQQPSQVNPNQQTPWATAEQQQTQASLDSQRAYLEAMLRSQGAAPQGYSNPYLNTTQQGQQAGLSQFPQSTSLPYPNQGQPSGGVPIDYQSLLQGQNYSPAPSNNNPYQSSPYQQSQNGSPAQNQGLSQGQVQSNVGQYDPVTGQSVYRGTQSVNQLQGLMNNAFAVPQQAPAPQQYQTIPQGFTPQQETIGGTPIDQLLNRQVPKASAPGYASAETLVRQFGTPIEQAAELINESHVRLEDWTMDLYGKAQELAEVNVALQNHANGQQDALIQQDELLKVYAKQMLNHQDFVEELLPHLDRYEKMEELLLDSQKLADYYRNLAAVEAEYGTHQQFVAQQEQQAQYESQQVGGFLAALKSAGIDPSQLSREQLTGYAEQFLAQQGQQPQGQQTPQGIPQGIQLPYSPGDILRMIDPSQLSNEQVAEIRAMTPQQLELFEYQTAVQMGIMTPDGKLIQRNENQPVAPEHRGAGYAQYVNQQSGRIDPATAARYIESANPGIPQEARPIAPANVQTQPIPRQKQTFYQQVMNGAVPPSVDQVNQMVVEGRYAQESPTYNPVTKYDPEQVSRLRGNFPAATPQGEALTYPSLDELPANARFLLLDKLEREGVFGQKRVRI